ncbi:hypothetical protein M513_00215 [Trichuris suis]|uniref:Uncharacterized protein n=1 Tax=Trichuris suis TaxID=68888 RepID=A0A085MPA6_9BILA|nr:hypothetical protein M513_00215 [Trichuris suis]
MQSTLKQKSGTLKERFTTTVVQPSHVLRRRVNMPKVTSKSKFITEIFPFIYAIAKNLRKLSAPTLGRRQRKNFLGRYRDQQLRRSSSVSPADVDIPVESNLGSSRLIHTWLVQHQSSRHTAVLGRQTPPTEEIVHRSALHQSVLHFFLSATVKHLHCLRLIKSRVEQLKASNA